MASFFNHAVIATVSKGVDSDCSSPIHRMYKCLVADEFIQIRGLGRGLRLSDAGVLLVDSSRNWSWSGQHVFAEPVQFSGAQRYQIEQIVDNNATLGTVYWHNGLSIQKAAPGQHNKVLFFDGSRVSWSTPRLDYVTGTLNVSNGGTGLSQIARGAILFAPDNNYISGLPIGVHGQALVVQDGMPTWMFVGNIRGDTTSGFVPLSSSDNFLSNSPIFVSDNTVEINATLKLGSELIINSNQHRALIEALGTSIIIKKTGAFEIGATKFNANGVMTDGGVLSDLIHGLIPVSKGGTGLSRLAPGDLLYADTNGGLARLAAPSGEGWVLGISASGRPSWVDMAAVKIDGGHRRVRLETDGNVLFFVNDNKQRIALTGFNQLQSTSVTPVHLGGTGDDLSGVTRRGAILVARSRDAWTAIQPGPQGHVLSSDGPDSIPQWIEPPLVISAGPGIKLVDKVVSIDHNSEFTWTANHKFDSLESKFANVDVVRLKVLRNIESHSIGSIWTDGDDVYLQSRRGKKALVNSGSDISQKRVIVLPLAQTLNMSDDAIQASQLEACAVVVPFSVSNPSSATRWKLKRIDVLPFALSAPIRLQVKRNGQEIFEGVLNVHNAQVGCVDFIESILTSGDVLRLNAVVDGVNGFLNATALLEEYHG